MSSNNNPVWVNPVPTPVADAEKKQQTSGGFNMPTGSFSPIRYGTSFVNNTIGTPLGFGPGYNFVGPMQPSSAFTGASLTGTLTAAGLGYMGGGYLAGLMGGNQQTGSIGGGIGSAAGYALTAANPILGAVAGGVLGSVAGGLLGGKKKPSDKTMAGGIDLETGQVNRYYADRESSTGKKYSDSGAKLRDAVETGASKFSQFLLANGATPLDPKDNNSQQEMAFVIGGRDGYRLFTYDRSPDKLDASGKIKDRINVDQHKNYKNFGNDYNAYSKGIVEQMMAMYNIPDELRGKIEAMNITDIASFGQPQQGQSSGGSYSGARDIMLTPRNKDNSQSFKDFLTNYRSKYNANAVQ